MPLDIHIAGSPKKAEVKRREMFIDERLHELIFTKYASVTQSTKYLPRFSDYYGECSFDGEDVRALAGELRSLAVAVSESALRNMLFEFASVCERAAASREGVYLFGD